MNFGAKVLEVLACLWSDPVRTCEGTELKEVEGEFDCCRSCLEVGVGVGEAKRSDFEPLVGDMGEGIDMSELYDLV